MKIVSDPAHIAGAWKSEYARLVRRVLRPPRASDPLVFNAGSFESARSGFANYARDGESAKELRMRVNRTILEDLEAKVLALRALHAKLRDQDAGESFGDVVAQSRPRSEML